MDLFYLAQIGSFVSPNDGWVRSAATKWMKDNKFCFLLMNYCLDERTKKGFVLSCFLDKATRVVQNKLKSLSEIKLSLFISGKTT